MSDPRKTASTKGDKVVVRFKGRDFEFWRGDGWTPKRWQANRYSYGEAMAVRRRINEAKGEGISSVVDFISAYRSEG